MILQKSLKSSLQSYEKLIYYASVALKSGVTELFYIIGHRA